MQGNSPIKHTHTHAHTHLKIQLLQSGEVWQNLPGGVWHI
jgi:hypothetical protein